ncbi:hypothetical protein M1L60_31950 [Actinoplanes sp. TRM 88003]|uniref:Lipoprotein n=1 Tax=Paractinoplanes aksuensis TaxID=2939490 RepID=A0ABT1DWQ3_9ACTN|nr:hypothetical protein [Actinoplanes aksuensis]MCO8275205.1 hypothetical protein [Actinoplanes aksuensis]
MTLIKTRAAVVLLGAAMLAAGCGKTVTIGDAGDQPAPPPAASVTTPAEDDELKLVNSTAEKDGKTGNGGTVIGIEVQEQPPVWVQLSAVTSPPLNKPHLININQAALYRFDDDSADPSKTTCFDDCAQKWPPVTIQETGNVYLAGVDPEMIGAIRRDDGTVQLTVGGWPVYRFAQDKNPGDLKGQGVGGTWFAVAPDGQRVK